MIVRKTFSPQMIAALPAVIPESGLSWTPVGKYLVQIAPRQIGQYIWLPNAETFFDPTFDNSPLS